MVQIMKIGVYICHCGINIAATVDIEKVTAFAQTLPHVADRSELSVHVFRSRTGSH